MARAKEAARHALMFANARQAGEGFIQALRQAVGARAYAAKSKTTSTTAQTLSHDDMTQEQKAIALDAVLKNVNQKYGRGSLMRLGSSPQKVETTPSGCLLLDVALGGGYPKGRIVEVYGPESSGKTTLALHAMAEVQRRGGQACLVDAEHAFDPVYSKNAGLDVDNLLLCQPDSGEMALQVVDELARSGAMDLIAVDSVAALVPRSEIQGDMGLPQVGVQARLMSHALRKLTANASKMRCTIMFINQIRYKVGVMYGNPETTSGGNALKFYASVRVDVRRKDSISGPDGELTGIRVRAKVVKNKVAPPYRTADFDIHFGSGIDGRGCILDAAEASDVVTRRGSYYYYGDRRLGQGREKAMAALSEDRALQDELERLVREGLARGELPGVVDTAAGVEEEEEDGSGRGDDGDNADDGAAESMLGEHDIELETDGVVRTRSRRTVGKDRSK